MTGFCFRLALLVLALLVSPTLALAQDQPGVSLSTDAGFDGYYRVGQWLPVSVLIQNDGPSLNGRLEAVLPRPDGGEVTYHYPVELATQSRKEIRLNVLPQQTTNRLKLVLLNETGQTVASQEVPLRALGTNDQLYGVLADQPSAFNRLMELDPVDGAALVTPLTIRHLPERAAALAALNTLIVSNEDTGELSETQRAAIASWVAGGGRLVVTGGANWQKTSAGLRDLLPLQPADVTALDDLSGLASFAGVTTPPPGALITTGALTPGAQALALQGSTPLVVRKPVGLGEVAFLGFDPAALAKWEGLTDVFRQITTAKLARPSWAYGVQDWGTAASAAATIPNLNLPPVSLICGFVIAYMAIIGPVNYLIVRRLKRRELAWITVPLLAVGFTLAAFAAGTLLRGTEPALSRLALVQIWPDAPQAQVTGIVGVYAPQRATYEITATHGLLLHPPFDDRPYSAKDTSHWTVSDDGATQYVRAEMDVSEIKTLSAEGAIVAPDFAVNTQIIVDENGARAEGTVTNHSELTLQDAVLLAPGQAVTVGTVPPNASVPISFQLSQAASAADSTNSTLYNGNMDNTLEDLVGPYYSSGLDQTKLRRREMANSLLSGYSSNYRSRGDGLYLAGWTEQSPLPVGVADSTFDAHDTTLYIIDLKPTLRIMSGTLTLPPGLFKWQSENSSGPSISPYNSDLYNGKHILQFSLARPLLYEHVQNLTMHLQGPGIGQQTIKVSLWNQDLQDWTPLPNVQPGDNVIVHPEQYVGPGGEIRVQLEVTSSNYAHLDQLDFTLKVQ